jgi:hypothetical protein
VVQAPEGSIETNKLVGSGTPGLFFMLELGGGMEYRLQSLALEYAHVVRRSVHVGVLTASPRWRCCPASTSWSSMS